MFTVTFANTYEDYFYKSLEENPRYFNFMNKLPLPSDADGNDCHKM